MNAKIRQHLAEIESNSQIQERYAKLAKFADEVGLPDEAQRAEEAIREYEADSDDHREVLLRLGFDPDAD